ncbi:hypothetical protein VUN82_10200 [Micrococcaceae bacterium Sec5.1]
MSLTAQGWTTHAKEYDYTRTGRPDIDWDEQDAKDGLVSALVTAAELTKASAPENSDGAVHTRDQISLFSGFLNHSKRGTRWAKP